MRDVGSHWQQALLPKVTIHLGKYRVPEEARSEGVQGQRKPGLSKIPAGDCETRAIARSLYSSCIAHTLNLTKYLIPELLGIGKEARDGNAHIKNNALGGIN